MDAAIELVVSELRTSKKYAWICTDVLHRVAVWSLQRYPQKQAVKEAKRKLHQIFGSYVAGNFNIAPDSSDTAALLSQHASTLERMSCYQQVFPQIWALTGLPSSVIDVACGLNPIARELMGLPDSCRVVGCDIDSRMVNYVNQVMTAHGWAGECLWADALGSLPQEHFDVALVFKTLPCLEQQRKDGSLQLLRQLNADNLVVSYPTKSLGGRNKGMLQNYRQQFSALMTQCGWQYTEIVAANELFFVVTSVNR